MTAEEVIEELRGYASQTTKMTHMRHGAIEPLFGVKVEDLKKIQKRVKVDHALALELYDSGISDAMYLAGLIADDAKMTKKDLQKWAKNANWSMLREYTVAWVAAGSKFGLDLALEWIESKQEGVATVGWSTLSHVVALKPDDELDSDQWKALLKRVETTIHQQPNRVKYVMNNFVISVASYVLPLNSVAKATAKAIGKVSVDVGDTWCKVPLAIEYIEKVESKGKLGVKRKTVKC